MLPRSKSSYHPYLLVAFYLHCLPDELVQHIPRSTRYGWLHKDQASLYGYDWYLQNHQTFDTLQQVVAHKKLLQINRALLRIIALQKFIRDHAHRIKDNIFDINLVVLNNLYKTIPVFGLQKALKYLNQPYGWYLKLRMARRCRTSLFDRCRVKHPAQLLSREIDAMQAYCTRPQYRHWPLASLYHLMRREGSAPFTLGTFYKYIRQLDLKRSRPGKRRKNHYTGIRAKAPLQILHADATLFQTADHHKSYVHLVQDNFSRTILSHRVARECKAVNTFDNLQDVIRQYLVPNSIEACQLLTDDGSENAGPVKQLIAAHPFMTHLVAQRDITFSNSMIEAANKQLKYRFLYYRHIPDHQALIVHVQQAVEDFNNRPHDVLHGLTPLEVLQGKTFDKDVCQQQITQAKAVRIAENRKNKCCHDTF